MLQYYVKQSTILTIISHTIYLNDCMSIVKTNVKIIKKNYFKIYL